MLTNRVWHVNFLIGMIGLLLLIAPVLAEECFTKEHKGLTMSNCVDGKPMDLVLKKGGPPLVPPKLVPSQAGAQAVWSGLPTTTANDNVQAQTAQPPAFALPGSQAVYGPEKLRGHRQVQMPELPAIAAPKP